MNTTLAMLAIFGVYVIIIMYITRKPPGPPDAPYPDQFDVLLDDYMIYDPNLDGRI
jgi:hypothetical protein